MSYETPKRVTKTRWGDITEEGSSVTMPAEHPYAACAEAVFKAGNLFECLRWRHQCELVYKCVEIDHIPLPQRIEELAVHVIAMGIHGGWAQDYFGITPEAEELHATLGGEPLQAADCADRAAMWLEAQSLADEWRESERQDRKERREKRDDDAP
jgi:hypothetical protein